LLFKCIEIVGNISKPCIVITHELIKGVKPIYLVLSNLLLCLFLEKYEWQCILFTTFIGTMLLYVLSTLMAIAYWEFKVLIDNVIDDKF
jgi:hypothetical protein